MPAALRKFCILSFLFDTIVELIHMIQIMLIAIVHIVYVRRHEKLIRWLGHFKSLKNSW